MRRLLTTHKVRPARRVATRLRSRRGVTAVLAMVYLMLFSTLALGFYATVNTSAQVAKNDRGTTGARVAAESGMQFMKYQLGTLGIPPRTDPVDLFDTTYARLKSKLEGTPNMTLPVLGPQIVGMKTDPANGQPTIYIPDGGSIQDRYIRADAAGHWFRAEVTRWPLNDPTARGLRVKVIGKDQASGTITADTRGARGVRLNYDVATNAARIFNYGVSSRSSISLQGNVSVVGTQAEMGSILSTTTSGTPVTLGGGASISGDLTYASGTPSISSNSSVAGFKPGDPGYAEHVKKTDFPPEFPLIDTSAYVAFAPPKGSTGPRVITGSSPGSGPFRNIRIKAGANPTFGSGALLEGVIVVEHPNQVKFTSDTVIQAAIVSETDDYENNGINNEYLVEADLADRRFDNKIEFAGNTTVKSIADLDPAVFPQALRDLKGAMMVVPGFAANFTGSFGTVSGSIIASQLSFSGDASGTIKGSVVNLEDTKMEIGGNNTIIIESQGPSSYPDGIVFGQRFEGDPGTYQEVRP